MSVLSHAAVGDAVAAHWVLSMGLSGEWMERLRVGATSVSAEPSLGFTMAQALAMCMKKPSEYSIL